MKSISALVKLKGTPCPKFLCRRTFKLSRTAKVCGLNTPRRLTCSITASSAAFRSPYFSLATASTASNALVQASRSRRGRSVRQSGGYIMKRRRPPGTSRTVLPTLRLKRPRCLECGGYRLRRYRSIRDQGDGSSLSWVRCLDSGCGHRFRMVLE